MAAKFTVPYLLRTFLLNYAEEVQITMARSASNGISCCQLIGRLFKTCHGDLEDVGIDLLLELLSS